MFYHNDNPLYATASWNDKHWNFVRAIHISEDEEPNHKFHCDHCKQDFSRDLRIYDRRDEVKPHSNFCAACLNLCSDCTGKLDPTQELKLKYKGD